MMTIDDIPLTFGKYQGKTPDQIAEIDDQYIIWMYDNIEKKHCSKELRDSCEQDVRDREEGYYPDVGFGDYDFWK